MVNRVHIHIRCQGEEFLRVWQIGLIVDSVTNFLKLICSVQLVFDTIFSFPPTF